MTETKTQAVEAANPMRIVIILVMVVAAFFGAYKFASARSAGTPAGTTVASTDANGNLVDPAAAGGCGGACCGGGAPTANGISGEPVEGVATVAGDIQKIDVDVTTVYNPNVIKLKAGVPAEITFSQAAGCTAQVQSEDLNFYEDLSAGPRTVKLPALETGTYAFSCGMQMVFGKIVVE